MTDADINYEYRQMKARDWEIENKKPYSEKAVDEDVIIDDEYEEWQRSVGVKKDARR